MSLSSFLIRIILLVLPGIACSSFYRHLRGRRTRKDWEDFLEILIFSFLCYTIYGLLTYALSSVYSTDDPLAAFRALTNENVQIDRPVARAIIWALVIAIPVAFVASYIDEYKLINRFGWFIQATKRIGDEDIWDYFNRSPDIVWVNVRDHKLDLYYYGRIEAWSDSGEERELLLRKVEVYKNSTAEFLYESDVVYISRKPDDLTIDADLSSNNRRSHTDLKGEADGEV